MALEKGRVLFLVTTSTSPSLQAYAELHALFSEGVYKPLAAHSKLFLVYLPPKVHAL